MPYGIKMQGSRHCVFNTNTGAIVAGGCHPTHGAALAHQRALMLNVPDALQHGEDDETVSWIDASGTHQFRKMTRASINDLPDSAFAYIEPGGSKDNGNKTTPRSKRHFPIHDEAHVRNALARLSQSPHGPKARAKVVAAARRMGIKVATQANERPAVFRDSKRLVEQDLNLQDLREGYGDTL